MLDGPASTSAVSTSASSNNQDFSSPLDAYLQTQSYQPPIEQWRNDADGFQDRMAAANYSFPPQLDPSQAPDDHHPVSLAHLSYPYPPSLDISKSSVAPSSMAPTAQHYPPPTLHHHHQHPAASASASASQYSAYGHPPSLIDDRSSIPESSIDTSRGLDALRGPHEYQLEEGPDGVLVRPAAANNSGAGGGTVYYECTFPFLGCRFASPDEDHWRTHNLMHLHGNPPPRSTAACPLCDWGYRATERNGGGGGSGGGYTAWEARMSHLAAHLRLGQTLRGDGGSSRPDSALYRYLWQKRIIDDAEYKELSAGGSLVSVRSSAPQQQQQASGPFQTTQGLRADDRRDRNGRRYPRTRG